MSHGHSHDGGHGHSHGGHGHSHGGPAPKKSLGLSDMEMNQMHDDDPTPRKELVRPIGDPQSLEEAAEAGSLSTAIMSVARGTTISRTDESVGATPLHWACLRGHMSIVRFLVDQGADTNQKDSRGQTPMFWALTENKLEAVAFLLEHGADPAASDNRGCDCFSVAAQHGSLAMLHLLCAHKQIDIQSQDNDKHNALVWACYKGHKACAEYLYYIHKMSPNTLDDRRRTALHWASREGHAEICVWLTSIGLSSSQTDDEQMSPTQWAKKNGHWQCHNWLSKGIKEVPSPLFGTVSSLTKNYFFPAAIALSVVWVALGYTLVSRLIPAAVAYSILGSYGMKGMAMRALLPFPRKASVTADPTITDMVGMPRNADEAFRGHEIMNFRDPGVPVAIAGCIVAQYAAMYATGMQPSALFYALSASAVLLGAVAKHDWRSGLVAKGTVEEDPVLKAVERKEFEDCRWNRIYRASHHMRVPLRAFHCKELDAVIQEYSGWSLMLDAPVNRANRRSFMLFLLSLLALEIHVGLSSWVHFSAKYCKPDEEFSIIMLAWNLFISCMPCRMPYPTDSTGYWVYVDYVLPQEDNRNAFWLMAVAGCIALGVWLYVQRELQAIVHGCSSLEMLHQTMPSTEGGLTPIFRNGHCVFSSGGYIRNFVAFWTGSAGSQWRGTTSIPPPQKGSNPAPRTSGGQCCN